MDMPTCIKVPAIKFRQGKDCDLYSFVIDGKRIPEFANIVRIGRDCEQKNQLFGYQRPEVYSHIREIRRYLESENPILPNALVVAFERGVNFNEFKSSEFFDSNFCPGVLEIPCSNEGDMKIGWIVDGQQRTAAIREATIQSFPVAVVAFIAGEDVQREQFILVNSTKPLPKDLIYELLPSTNARLAQSLEKKKIPSLIATILNYPPSTERGPTPFAGRIKTPTNQKPSANISYNSVLKMLENSLNDGFLMHQFEVGGVIGLDHCVDMINEFWGAVEQTFQVAWKLPPTKSRLTHGAGMIAMGFLMETIIEEMPNSVQNRIRYFRNELEKIAENCAWIEGEWDFGRERRRWNDIQNIPRDIEALTNLIQSIYRSSP